MLWGFACLCFVVIWEYTCFAYACLAPDVCLHIPYYGYDDPPSLCTLRRLFMRPDYHTPHRQLLPAIFLYSPVATFVSTPLPLLLKMPMMPKQP